MHLVADVAFERAPVRSVGIAAEGEAIRAGQVLGAARQDFIAAVAPEAGFAADLAGFEREVVAVSHGAHDLSQSISHGAGVAVLASEASFGMRVSGECG